MEYISQGNQEFYERLKKLEPWWHHEVALHQLKFHKERVRYASLNNIKALRQNAKDVGVCVISGKKDGKKGL